MTKLTITQGNVASGKSTFAHNRLKESPLDTIIAERDQIRMQLYHGFRKCDCDKLTPQQEEAVTRFQNKLIEDHLKGGYNVIVSDTNLYPSSISKFNKLAQKHGAEFEVVRFTDVSVETCIKRNAQRPEDERIPEHVIHRFQKRINSMKKKNKQIKEYDSQYNMDGELVNRCFIYDLDGTVAHMAGRYPFDAKKSGTDIPNMSTIIVLKALMETYKDCAFIAVSGRTDDGRDVTEQFLKDYGIEPHYLYMRKSGDYRKDSIIKEEIYNKYIKDVYNVIGVFDDRRQVCQLWVDLGCAVFNVRGGINDDF